MEGGWGVGEGDEHVCDARGDDDEDDDDVRLQQRWSVHRPNAVSLDLTVLPVEEGRCRETPPLNKSATCLT